MCRELHLIYLLYIPSKHQYIFKMATLYISSTCHLTGWLAASIPQINNAYISFHLFTYLRNKCVAFSLGGARTRVDLRTRASSISSLCTASLDLVCSCELQKMSLIVNLVGYTLHKVHILGYTMYHTVLRFINHYIIQSKFYIFLH